MTEKPKKAKKPLPEKWTVHHTLSWAGTTVLGTRGKSGVTATLSGPQEHFREPVDKYNTAYDYVGKTPDGRNVTQEALWHHTYKPPVVDGLFSTKGGRNMVGSALGHLALVSHQKYGRLPVASEDLSQHSKRVVDTVRKIQGEEPSSEESPRNLGFNSLGFKDAHRIVGEQVGNNRILERKPLDPKEAAMGSQVMRSQIKYAREGKLNKNQFHQPELPL